MTPNTEPPSSAPPRKKPRFALAIATALGVGYIPRAPGTCGSIIGLAAAVAMTWLGSRKLLVIASMERPVSFWTIEILPSHLEMLVAVLVAILGVVVANRVANYANAKDPQYVVIDEVSGQLLTFCIPLTVFNWKSLILGFILFRVFDIWKPFPVRQAERLPGGWGIMADDWVAAIYAALGLWVARYLGL